MRSSYHLSSCFTLKNDTFNMATKSLVSVKIVLFDPNIVKMWLQYIVYLFRKHSIPLPITANCSNIGYYYLATSTIPYLKHTHMYQDCTSVCIHTYKHVHVWNYILACITETPIHVYVQCIYTVHTVYFWGAIRNRKATVMLTTLLANLWHKLPTPLLTRK